ncbi:hypothetical protein IT414_02200 [bacterium]|nr:hypothetical protein [bacterium]
MNPDDQTQPDVLATPPAQPTDMQAGVEQTISQRPTIIPPPQSGPPTPPPAPNTSSIIPPPVTPASAPQPVEHMATPAPTVESPAPSLPTRAEPIVPQPQPDPAVGLPEGGPAAPSPLEQMVSHPVGSAPQPQPATMPTTSEPASNAAPVAASLPSATPSSQHVALPMKPSKIPLILGVVFAALLLISGAVYAFSLLFGGFSKVSKPVASTSTLPSKTASSLADYSALCNRTTISNSAGFGAKPHKAIFFQSSAVSEDDYTQSVLSFADKTWEATTKDLASIQLVGCLKRTNPVKAKQCSFTSSGKQVNINYYSVTYQLSVFEAKTGKSRVSGTISGTADKCPSSVLYNPSDPKVFANPDSKAVEDAIKELMNS